MIRMFVYYFLASVLCILGTHYLHMGLVYFDMFYTYVNVLVAPFFGLLGLGMLIHQILLLILIPCIITGIPALLYRLIKKKTMPGLVPATWAVWLILFFSIMMIH